MVGGVEKSGYRKFPGITPDVDREEKHPQIPGRNGLTEFPSRPFGALFMVYLGDN